MKKWTEEMSKGTSAQDEALSILLFWVAELMNQAPKDIPRPRVDGNEK